MSDHARCARLGTINGSGNYRFVLTVIDANLKASTQTGSFRIRVWDESDGGVVYDSGLGADVRR